MDISLVLTEIGVPQHHLVNNSGPLVYSAQYCEIIFFRCTFNFMYFVGSTIHELKIPMKYLVPRVIFDIILNP